MRAATHRLLVIFAVILSATALGPTPPAAASHYALTQVDFVTSSERRALSRAGILDTRVLLDWAATRAGRQWLARTTGIATKRLEALAARCDLMRVGGVGPSIVEVLVMADIADTRALARTMPGPLLARMRTATRGHPMHHKLPAEDTLATWVAEARLLRPVLELAEPIDPMP